MKVSVFYPRLFSVMALVLLIGFGVSGEENIKFSNTSIRQGDFFQVKVNAPSTATVQVAFLGEKQRLQFTDSGNFIGLVAVSYYASLGDHTFSVEIQDGNETSTSIQALNTYQIQILERSFTESRVKISEKTRKEILTPGHQEYDSQKGQEVRGKALVEVVPPLWDGIFVWPLKGKLTTNFGLIRYVNDIENGRHSGLDIAAPTGTPVTATNNGRVIFAGTLYQTGLTVILHHGMNLYTTYGHFSVIKVTEGQNVSKGEVVGLVGATGLATGAHLHLTFRVGNIPVDPYLFLDKELRWEFD